MSTSKLLACINISILLWILIALAFATMPALRPPVYGWRETGRQVVTPIPTVAALLRVAVPTAGQQRAAIELDSAGNLSLVTSSWQCVANCAPSNQPEQGLPPH